MGLIVNYYFRNDDGISGVGMKSSYSSGNATSASSKHFSESSVGVGMKSKSPALGRATTKSSGYKFDQ